MVWKLFEYSVTFFQLLLGSLSQKCPMFKSATYLSLILILQLFQIILLSNNTDTGSLFIRISRCVLWTKETCTRNQLAQMKSGTLLLSSCGDDGREGKTLCTPCLWGRNLWSIDTFRNMEFVILFSHLLYSAHILTSFLTGRITRQWLFSGSGLIKMEISWILELGKLFKKGSWQGIFAQDFMCKGWI